MGQGKRGKEHRWVEGCVAHWLEPHIDKQIDVAMNIRLVIIAKTWRNEEPDIIEGGKVRKNKTRWQEIAWKLNVGTDLVNGREKLTGDIFTFHTLGWLVLMCIRSGTAEMWNMWSTCNIIQMFNNNYLLSIGIYTMACIKMTLHVKTSFLSFLLQHPRDFLTLLKRPRSNQRVS